MSVDACPYGSPKKKTCGGQQHRRPKNVLERGGVVHKFCRRNSPKCGMLLVFVVRKGSCAPSDCLVAICALHADSRGHRLARHRGWQRQCSINSEPPGYGSQCYAAARTLYVRMCCVWTPSYIRVDRGVLLHSRYECRGGGHCQALRGYIAI